MLSGQLNTKADESKSRARLAKAAGSISLRAWRITPKQPDERSREEFARAMRNTKRMAVAGVPMML